MEKNKKGKKLTYFIKYIIDVNCSFGRRFNEEKSILISIGTGLLEHIWEKHNVFNVNANQINKYKCRLDIHADEA